MVCWGLMWLLPNDSGLGSIAKLIIWLCYCRFLLNFALFWVNQLSVIMCNCWFDDGSICAVRRIYWTCMILLKSSHTFKKHWEKCPRCVVIYVFVRYFIICSWYSSFDFDCSLWWYFVDRFVILYYSVPIHFVRFYYELSP